MKCKDCKSFKKCDDILFRTSNVHLKDEDHSCIEYMVWGDSDKAFEAAIESGRLSRDKEANNYAGHYMYMGTVKNRDLFKHSCTRNYIQ